MVVLWRVVIGLLIVWALQVVLIVAVLAACLLKSRADGRAGAPEAVLSERQLFEMSPLPPAPA